MFSFNNTELSVLESGITSIGIFFRLDTVPPVRLWLGFGNIAPGINVLDPEGAVYAGFGALRDIPTINQLLNGSAERVEFALSGTDADILSLVSDDDVERVKGRRATVGFALMATDWSLLGQVHWCAFYVADYLELAQQPSDATQQIVRTVSLSCGSRFTGRRRPSLSYFSDQDQQRRFPGDLFCSLTKQYAHGFNKQWPIFS
ncbi:hypothetical protein [Bradyrhizobium lablabi]|uniref:hypothetical protein n=1 Tax=Bradyrhizobium lablabi TaxID=722472 RepID=UPI001BA799C0|nr:hypothetical protein [Bradyrhizobium lablabi]MBR0695943.1 hypothetical protein [Bradyrhizobium lablabi]